jgi:hypothetical integral membrane protein (TIGR02206 family)
MDLFSVEWSGEPFVLLSAPHLLGLAGIVALNLWLSRFRSASERIKRRIRYSIVAVLWTNEVLWHTWMMRLGTWNLQHALPLELCSIFVWGGGIMMLTRSRRLYEIAYFLGAAGALQALATPDLGVYGFPHYRYWAFFISHGLIVTTVAWMTYGEGYRPTRRSYVRSLIAGVVLMVAVLGIDLALGANYMFLGHKPETASLLDASPPWPYYIPWLFVVGVVMFALLYAPWEVADRLRARKKPAADARVVDARGAEANRARSER